MRSTSSGFVQSYPWETDSMHARASRGNEPSSAAPGSAAQPANILDGLKVAIVHDYLNQRGGAEKVVLELHRLFPEAPVFTSVFDSRAMGPSWDGIDVRTSFMQRAGSSVRFTKLLLPVLPVAFELFDFGGYDLVLSSSSAFAKGIITQPETCHVCYCYTPARFLWRYHDYVARQSLPPGSRSLLPAVTTLLRVWDTASTQRVDDFIAISPPVAERIRKWYGRESTVIEPPVDVATYKPSPSIDSFYLVVARLQSYKRIDLAVQACSELGVPLKVVGVGPDLKRLRSMASDGVEFLGYQSEEHLRSLLATCRALIWPGEEDFGLVPIEAMASGRPVIAFNGGGAAHTVIDGVTGMHFREQSIECLVDAIGSFQPEAFDVEGLRKHACSFDVGRFRERLGSHLATVHARYKAARLQPAVIP
jgi:glycosyltransferase involved in cell wall biosynthesis